MLSFRLSGRKPENPIAFGEKRDFFSVLSIIIEIESNILIQ